MANVLRATGFTPVGEIGGSTYNASLARYPIAYNYGTAIGIGDPVKLVSGKINKAANTDQVAGILVGFELPVVSAYGTVPGYWPAGGFATLGNQDCYGLIVEDPNVIFVAQFSNSTIPALSNVGSYIKTADAGVNTVTGISGVTADSGTFNTAVSGLIWRFLGFLNRGDNDTTAIYSRGLFQCANHRLAATVAAS